MAVLTAPESIGTPEEKRQTAARAPEKRSLRTAWEARGVWLGPAAWLLALLGLTLLGDEPGRTWGGLLVVLAGVLAVLAWGSYGQGRAFASRSWLSERASSREQAFAVAKVAVSALLVLTANIVYLLRSDDTFGLAGWLWLAGMVSLVGATATWPRPESRKPVRALGPFKGVHSSLPVRHSGTTTYRRDVPQDHGTSSQPWPRWEIAAFVGLALVALALRTWDLRAFPDNIYPDEIMTGSLATQAYLDRSLSHPSVFSTIWGGIDLPALWFALVAGALRIVGDDLGALRLPAAICGAATVIPFYGLVRDAWGRYAALAGTAVLAFSASNLHYSRVALNNIVTPFFWTLCFFFLLRGLQRQRPVYWALAGIAAGLSEYSYYGTRLLPFILAAFVAYLLIVHWQQARHFLGKFALLALGYVAGIGPLLSYYATHPSVYFGHGSDLLTWNRVPTSLQELGQMWTTLWPLMADNLLGISARASQDVIYFAPLLLGAEAAMLALGAGLLVWRWRHPTAFLMLLSGLGVLFVGGTLVKGAPSINHWTPAFPALYAAVAAPVGAWAASWQRLPLSGRARRAIFAGLAFGLALLAWLNVDFYFRHYYADPGVLLNEGYRNAQTSYEAITAQSRFAASLGPNYRVFTVGPQAQVYDPQTTYYLVKGVEWSNMPDATTGLPITATAGKGIAFVFFPGTPWVNEQQMELVSAVHPGGASGEVRTPTGKVLFYTYVLPP